MGMGSLEFGTDGTMEPDGPAIATTVPHVVEPPIVVLWPSSPGEGQPLSLLGAMCQTRTLTCWKSKRRLNARAGGSKNNDAVADLRRLILTQLIWLVTNSGPKSFEIL